MNSHRRYSVPVLGHLVCAAVVVAACAARAGVAQTATATFSSVEHQFSVEFPRQWIRSVIPAKVGAQEFVLTVEDPRRKTGAGEPGSVQYPLLTVNVLDRARYTPVDPATLLEVPPDEIASTERSVTVSGRMVELRRYASSAAEGATRITYTFNMLSNAKVHVVTYSYTLAGCSNVGQAFRADCIATNDRLSQDSERIFAAVIDTFKIR
jgi:hypothetical protein